MLTFHIEAPPGASEAMRQIVAALDGQLLSAYTERAALKLVEAPLARLKAAPAEERLAFVFEALDYLPTAPALSLQFALKGIVSGLLRAGDIPLTSLDAVRLVEAVTKPREAFPFKAVLGAIEKQGQPVNEALREALTALRPLITDWLGSGPMAELHERIDTLLRGGPKEGAPLGGVDGWSRLVFAEIDDSPKQMAWRAMFLHARSLTQSTASRKWQVEAVSLADRVGRAEVLAAGRRWLALGPMPGVTGVQVPDEEADYQKGFIWLLGAIGDDAVAPDIADFAFACFRKIPMIGAVSHRVGNACVNALAAMPGLNAVTQLSRLAMRVKYDVARRLIEKALAEAATRNGVSRDDLEAMAVPTGGLDETGVRIEALGSCEARLAIEDGGAAVSLTWRRDGKSVKSVPAEVKTDHAEALAELKKAVKELDAVVSTQRLRLERKLLSEATCRYEQWQAWYLNHPATSVFARRLIWEIGGATAIWSEGKLVDWSGQPVSAAPDAPVRLWHPVRSDVQTVLSWRCWLEDHGVRQPFKQAHREVYILTEAERQTGTFSNRFASHVVRQHQFAALCRERGWQFNLMGQWDSHNTPTLTLPAHKLRVEFDVEFSRNEESTAHAVYLTIVTGSMRFYTLDAAVNPGRFHWPPLQPQPLSLDQVPALVFSEVMRDADLLVGVTSIGSDPAWATRDEGEHAGYWQSFAFGELSTAAENRRTVIEALLPKLAIRNQCSLDGRFLTVRGTLHEYKIHLGSGNILMEPGSRYLCIVQGPGDTAGGVALPFDGDRILAVILSKALMLANDQAIKDPTILKQIRG